MPTETFTIEKLMGMGAIGDRHKAVVNLTSDFLGSRDKELFYKDNDQIVDKAVVDQYAIFDEFTPVDNSNDPQIIEFLFKQNMAIGSLVASEIPNTRGGEVMILQGKAVKIALANFYDEDFRLKYWELLQRRVIPEGLLELLFNDTKSLMHRVTKTANVMMAQLWYRGRLDYLDPRTGISIAMGLKTVPQLFPAPLTAGAAWSNPTTGNAIADIQTVAERWYQVNSYYPEYVVMSKKALNFALAQQSTYNSAAALNLLSAVPSGANIGISLMMFNKALEARQLPVVRVWDAQYEVEIQPGVTHKLRYFPDDTIFFGNPKIGRRIFPPTIESIDDKNPKGGLYQRYMKDPYTGDEKNKVVGRYFPLIEDARKLSAQKVF